MSSADVRQKIGIVELALKNAGPSQAINATIDVLKEIAKALENCENSASAGPSPKPRLIPEVPEPRGRKFRNIGKG